MISFCDKQGPVSAVWYKYLIRPLAPCGAKAINHWSPTHPALDHSTYILPDNRSSRISFYVYLLQLFLGRPLFLLLCGFHVTACRVMLVLSFLMVCPTQLHFRLTIYFPIGSWSALCHNSSLGTLSNHLILNIVRKYLLIKIWKSFIQVPAPRWSVAWKSGQYKISPYGTQPARLVAWHPLQFSFCPITFYKTPFQKLKIAWHLCNYNISSYHSSEVWLTSPLSTNLATLLVPNLLKQAVQYNHCWCYIHFQRFYWYPVWFRRLAILHHVDGSLYVCFSGHITFQREYILSWTSGISGGSSGGGEFTSSLAKKFLMWLFCPYLAAVLLFTHMYFFFCHWWNPFFIRHLLFA